MLNILKIKNPCMYKILVTGAAGQLGKEIQVISSLYSDYNIVFVDSKALDITNHNKVKTYIENNQFNVIINCAAYTAVDKAESEPKLANAVNHLAVKNLAKIAKDNNIRLIHVSTDYVFDGSKSTPYTETDVTNPKSVYGQTKLDGELATKEINASKSIIIRTSWLYSQFGNNFVKTMLRLGKERDTLSVVSDQVGCPTNAADLAKVILDCIPKIKNDKTEVYHFSNNGVCSWYDFAKAIFTLSGVEINVKPINT